MFIEICHSEARRYRRRNLPFSPREADSSPITLARNDNGSEAFAKLHYADTLARNDMVQNAFAKLHYYQKSVGNPRVLRNPGKSKLSRGRCAYRSSAKILTGLPEPPSSFMGATTTIAPLGGTRSRLATFSS
jgi:hypothetical protein